jgi:hypothetical protein
MRLKMRGGIMRIVFMALLLAGTSVVATGNPSGSARQVTPPFSIIISTETPVVRAGSTVSIKVRLTNTSRHDVSVTRAYFEGVDANYKQEVRDANGNLAKRERSEPTVHLGGHWVRHTLKPGESEDGVTAVSPEYDMTRPGQYVIQLSRPISDNPDDGVVNSNKITVTVTP